MKDQTLIADLVRAGVSAELVGRVVNEITASMSRTNVPDNVPDILRAYETLRKRNQRKTGGKQTMSAEITPKNVPDNVPDKVAASLLTNLPSSNLSSSEELLESKQGSKEEVVARRPRPDRGTRLPIDWKLSAELTALAIEFGLVPAEFEAEFKDYWIGVPGARGRKCDWDATARNRIRETAKRKNFHGHLGTRTEISRGSAGGDRARELAQLAREWEDAAGVVRPSDDIGSPPSRWKID